MIVRILPGVAEVIDSGPAWTGKTPTSCSSAAIAAHAEHSRGGGIGLSIVRRLEDLYGWDVRLRPGTLAAWWRR